jgi:sugar phosphate isomerase/epimerase
MDNIVVSPCCNPIFDLELAFTNYKRIGYNQFEAFTDWTSSQFHYTQSPEYYKEICDRHGMKVTSLHLPPMKEDDIEGSVARAVQAAEFAEALGVEVVLYKGRSRKAMIAGAKAYLDATAHLKVIPVLQNHINTPIETLEHYKEVIDGINDTRMKTLLEVGHFNSVGVSWKQGYDLLGDTIALIHIKDQIGPQSVPFGKGEIDLPGLFKHMREVGYKGKYVIEFEVKDAENTLQYLADGLEYVKSNNI